MRAPSTGSARCARAAALLLLGTAVAAASGCPPSGTPTDAGLTPDAMAHAPDAALPGDASVGDAAAADAAGPDAALPDAAFPDAAVWDAAVPDDAGAGDAGPPDAGATVPPVVIARSLAWTQPALLDDPMSVGLSRLLSTVCPGTPGGVLLDRWLHTFATTAHSERPGAALLADELAAMHGGDPGLWPLDALPFRVTGIHHRLDLARDGHCGEFRVSMASTHPIYRPLHILWLFRVPGPDCAAHAQALADLSALAEPAFEAAARDLMDQALTPENFLLAESVEFTVSPWEWRQWTFATDGAGGCTPQNPPLFQQVDRDGINAAGPLRNAFLAFVEANADALDARRLDIPATFRAPSARVAQGIPWIPLDLTGLPEAVTAAHPRLRQHIEMVGCAACHTADAPFVQTSEDRTFSPFYQKELMARAEHLRRVAAGETPAVPSGPLQQGFVLPP